MKRNWTEEDLTADWHILPHEQEFIGSKRGATRLGFALLLKFFKLEGRFPSGPHEIPTEVVRFVASEVGVDRSAWDEYPWQGRSVEYHRASIRAHLGFGEATVADAEALETWLVEETLNQEHRMDRLRETVLDRCRKLHMEPPTQEQIRRLLRSAIQAHETRFCETISGKLDSATVDQLDALLEADPSRKDEEGWTLWHTLKEEPGRVGLDSVKEAASRLRLLRKVGLPAELFQGAPPKLVERYAKRSAVEEPFELRRHAGPLKTTLMAAFLHRRTEDLTDHLVDLLVETVHKMGKGAEKKIDGSLEKALQKKAPGKIAKLYRMAKASIEEPKGAVENVIFPVAPEQWLLALIEEVE